MLLFSYCKLRQKSRLHWFYNVYVSSVPAGDLEVSQLLVSQLVVDQVSYAIQLLHSTRNSWGVEMSNSFL